MGTNFNCVPLFLNRKSCLFQYTTWIWPGSRQPLQPYQHRPSSWAPQPTPCTRQIESPNSVTTTSFLSSTQPSPPSATTYLVLTPYSHHQKCEELCLQSHISSQAAWPDPGVIGQFSSVLPTESCRSTHADTPAFVSTHSPTPLHPVCVSCQPALAPRTTHDGLHYLRVAGMLRQSNFLPPPLCQHL